MSICSLWTRNRVWWFILVLGLVQKLLFTLCYIIVKRVFGQVGSVGRPGIVHRLDKETSGVMVVAKTQEAYLGLVQQFSERSLRKSYLALVTGKLKCHLVITASLLEGILSTDIR